MSKIIYYMPKDTTYLDIIKKVCPEHYDKALEKYLKDKLELLLKVQEEQTERWAKGMLVLEKHEKLREWLEKEIAFCNEQICDKSLDEGSKLHFASYKMGLNCSLEFILGKLSEGLK